jgi:hypothetical protein
VDLLGGVVVTGLGAMAYLGKSALVCGSVFFAFFVQLRLHIDQIREEF